MQESFTKVSLRLELEEVLEVDITKVVTIEIFDIEIRASCTVKWRIISKKHHSLYYSIDINGDKLITTEASWHNYVQTCHPI